MGNGWNLYFKNNNSGKSTSDINLMLNNQFAECIIYKMQKYLDYDVFNSYITY